MADTDAPTGDVEPCGNCFAYGFYQSVDQSVYPGKDGICMNHLGLPSRMLTNEHVGGDDTKRVTEEAALAACGHLLEVAASGKAFILGSWRQYKCSGAAVCFNCKTEASAVFVWDEERDMWVRDDNLACVRCRVLGAVYHPFDLESDDENEPEDEREPESDDEVDELADTVAAL